MFFKSVDSPGEIEKLGRSRLSGYARAATCVLTCLRFCQAQAFVRDLDRQDPLATY